MQKLQEWPRLEPQVCNVRLPLSVIKNANLTSLRDSPESGILCVTRPAPEALNWFQDVGVAARGSQLRIPTIAPLGRDLATRQWEVWEAGW